MIIRLNFDQPLLERMSEGLILLDRSGLVLSNNKASEFWVPRCHAMLGVFKSLIDEEIKGRILLPLRVGLWPDEKPEAEHKTEVWLIRNGRRDYALFFLTPQIQEVALQLHEAKKAIETNFITLLGDDIRQQMAVLRALMSAHEENRVRNDAAITAQSLRVDQLLQEISDLSQLAQQVDVFADERLVISDVVQQALLALPQNLDQISFGQEQGQEGVVYGHATWLIYAFRVLFESLISSAPLYSNIHISTRQLGYFIVITGHVSAGNRLQARSTRGSNRESLIANHSAPEKIRSAAIQQDMCRRIIALHAGQLKLDFMPRTKTGGDQKTLIESFMLTLPTGLPSPALSKGDCNDCLHKMQTEAYAADLAILLSQT